MKTIDSITMAALLGKCLEILNIKTKDGETSGMLANITDKHIIIGQKKEEKIPFDTVISITSGVGNNVCILYEN